MHKEVNDIVNVCDSILEKTQKINEISSEISKLARELEQNTEQADVPSKSGCRYPWLEIRVKPRCSEHGFDRLCPDLESSQQSGRRPQTDVVAYANSAAKLERWQLSPQPQIFSMCPWKTARCKSNRAVRSLSVAGRTVISLINP